MAGSIDNIAIIAKPNSIEAEQAAKRITRLLAHRVLNVYAVNPMTIEDSRAVEAEDLGKLELDIVFAIGGDGTTLRAFRYIPRETPLLSVNVGGNRGILSEIGIASLDESMNAVLLGQYFHERRIRIQASVGQNEFPAALNDIMVTRVNLTRTPLLSITLMGDVIEQRMDGIIISTPTGSTGHSFSIGGPVLYERLESLLLSPLAPMNKMPRLVLPPDEIEVRSTHDLSLVVDGQETYPIAAGQPLKISRHRYDAQFVRIRKRGMRQIVKLGF
ncbi:MAG TPA: NAD(+)/NADH kinase [Candidatus Nitrosopolaris sp.]|nr:NAD(+)/NADH kinase [Candidatus Nitrosopolaris sp.]